MALRDPTAAKDVKVVAHIYGHRVDAEVKRIDWAKTDARATSEKALENVIIKFDWDDGKTTKNYSEPIAEESLTLSDGLPFRTKDYEHALPAPLAALMRLPSPRAMGRWPRDACGRCASAMRRDYAAIPAKRDVVLYSVW